MLGLEIIEITKKPEILLYKYTILSDGTVKLLGRYYHELIIPAITTKILHNNPNKERPNWRKFQNGTKIVQKD